VSRKLPNPVAYIPPQCYARTAAEDGGVAHNPCYVCHTRAEPPNFVDDADLQRDVSLPPAARDNPWTNLFTPPLARAPETTDEQVLAYVRTSNYFDAAGGVALAARLQPPPPEWDLDHDGRWGGWVPDVGFRFDDEGFDLRRDGSRSGWRAYAYAPFPGAFLPTNGSADDALIRLDDELRENAAGAFDDAIYALNLAIVESLIRRADVTIPATDERALGVDLDRDGVLGRAARVAFDAGAGEGSTRMRWVGRARDDASMPIAPGLFPLRTEFAHSVRYLDVASDGSVVMAARMKELRYAKKVRWMGYAALRGHAAAEAIEQKDARDGTTNVLSDFERGVPNGQGWVYQGFIEDAAGALRPQTFEESVTCAGCHGGIGATTDGAFSFPRKLAAVPTAGGEAKRDAWFYWSRRGLHGIPEPRRRDGSYEYTRYLEENGAGDDFRDNTEVTARFFDTGGALRPDAVASLHDDISTLLVPSAARALALDRATMAVSRSRASPEDATPFSRRRRTRIPVRPSGRRRGSCAQSTRGDVLYATTGRVTSAWAVASARACAAFCAGRPIWISLSFCSFASFFIARIAAVTRGPSASTRGKTSFFRTNASVLMSSGSSSVPKTGLYAFGAGRPGILMPKSFRLM
jgi:hypothetical protein